MFENNEGARPTFFRRLDVGGGPPSFRFFYHFLSEVFQAQSTKVDVVVRSRNCPIVIISSNSFG